MKKHWSKFYWSDWRNEMTLKACSLASRGFWMEMLAIMGISERYGFLQVGGQKITMKQLAVMAGCSEDEAKHHYEELLKFNVFSISDDGIPYCRRMVREHEVYLESKKYGESGYIKKEEEKLEARATLEGGAIGGGCRGIELEFEECWNIYPDKSGKVRALEAFRKARKDGVSKEKIFDGINRYIAYLKHRQSTDFKDLKPKNGSTWFHQRCWNDEYTFTTIKQEPRLVV